MSEVQRYYVGKYGLVEGESLGRLSVVLGADFDRVTAERDALQQRLTAADERVDVLETALRTIMGSHRFNVAGMSVTEIHALCFDALASKAALKTVEGGGDDRPNGCCCPPKGFTGLWAGASCPIHQGLRAIKP